MEVMVTGAPYRSASQFAGSTTDLKLCEERFEIYAEHVYAALSSPDA